MTKILLFIVATVALVGCNSGFRSAPSSGVADLSIPQDLLERLSSRSVALRVTSSPQSVEQNTCSSAVGIALVNAYSGNAEAFTGFVGLPISSSSSNIKFYSDANCSTLVSLVTLNGASATGRFYFKDTAVESATVTANLLNILSASQRQTILAATTQPSPVPAPAPAPSPAPAPAPTPVPTPSPVAGCPGFPAFPDANCTGYKHTGVTLKKVPSEVSSGPGWHWEGAPFNYLRIDGSNVNLDSLDMPCIYVSDTVSSVSITRSRIAGNCAYLVRVDLANSKVKMNFTDVEFDGGEVQMKGGNFSWLRVQAHGFSGKAAMLGSNSVLEDSYIYGNVCYPPDHQSAIGTNGGASNMIMRHNNVDLTPSDCTSGGISNYDDFGAFHDILIERNLINSAGYCLKAGFEDGNAAGNSGMQVLNNVFGRKYNPECGTFGVVSNWMNGFGNIWSGNTWGDGARATSSHRTGDPVNP